MQLEVGKVYKSLAGCPVKLLELKNTRPEWEEDRRTMARVEYIDEVNNYGYGKGAVGWFHAGDLAEWGADAERG
jgi:hypothetical protein